MFIDQSYNVLFLNMFHINKERLSYLNEYIELKKLLTGYDTSANKTVEN